MPRNRIIPLATNQHGKPEHIIYVPKELGGGRRFFDKKKDAEEFAALKESERRGAANKLYGISENLAARVVSALDLLKGREDEIDAAARLYLAHNAKEQRTLQQAIAECIDRKRATGKRHRSLFALNNTLTRFSQGRESKPVHEVTPAECEAWICAPEAKSSSTRRSRQIDLGTFFSFCVKRGWCAKRPTDGLEKYTHGKKSPVILTVEQCESVLRAAGEVHDGEFLATVALQMFGGLRPYESYKVTRAMIKGGSLRLDETITKTLDVRIVTINPTLKAWLDRAWKIGSTLPAFDAPRRITEVRRTSVDPWPQDCLRHSFVSYHLELFGWESTVEQAGHSLATSFNHYRALTTKVDARKFWALRP